MKTPYSYDRTKFAGSHGDVKHLKNRPSLDISAEEDGIKIDLYAPEVVWADDINQADTWLDGVIKRAQAAKRALRSSKFQDFDQSKFLSPKKG